MSDNFQAAITFLLSGLLSGAVLSWLVQQPFIDSLLFFKQENTSKAFKSESVGLLLILVFFIAPMFAGVVISSNNNYRTQKNKFTLARCLLAVVSLGVGFPLLMQLCARLSYLRGNVFVTILMFATVFAFAMCLATRSLRLLPIACLACAVSITIAVGVTAFLYPFVEWQYPYGRLFVGIAPFFSLLSLCFGLWWQWQKARQYRKDA